MPLDSYAPSEEGISPFQISEIRIQELENDLTELTRCWGQVWLSYCSRYRYSEVASTYFLNQDHCSGDREECC